MHATDEAATVSGPMSLPVAEKQSHIDPLVLWYLGEA
jgi:hypothetical protein